MALCFFFDVNLCVDEFFTAASLSQNTVQGPSIGTSIILNLLPFPRPVPLPLSPKHTTTTEA
jgi:hypothetical protein